LKKNKALFYIIFLLTFGCRTVYGAPLNRTTYNALKAIAQDSTKKQSSNDVITLEQVKDSLALYRKHNNKLEIAKSYHRLGDLHRKLNNPSDAVAHYLMASNRYRELGKINRLVEVYHRLATVYREHNHFNKALEYANQAQRYASEIKNDSLIAMSAFQLGRIYEKIGNHGKAKQSYQTALNLFEKYNRSSHLADMYHHMAEVQEDLGHLNQSLEFHKKALSIRDEINDSSGLAKSFSQLGIIFAAKDDVDLAINYHQRAADIRDKLGNPIQKAQNYIKIGELHSSQGHLNRAVDYANRALHIANSFNALEIKVKALKLALDTHLRLGNIERVKELRDTLEELQDSLETLKHEQQQRNLTFHLQTQEKVDSLEQLQKAQEVQKAQLEKEHFLLIIAIIVALALIIILILLYNRYRYRKHQENLLRNKNEELEELNSRLETLNEEKNDIMQTVTHDMKNPLAGIIGLTDLALSDADSIPREEILEFMEQIEKAAQKMNDMIRKLLDIRTIESGGHNLDIEPNDIIKALGDVVQSNSQKAKEKDIKIVSKFSHNSEMVLGDQTAIQRVLDNLVSNAIKYSPKGKKVVLNLQKKNGTVRVEVKDEGPGIQPDEQSKLFTKFSRISTKPTGGEHSTGLGLYITKQLTNEMNGEVGCESKPGSGSTFFITLPRASQN